MTFNHLAFEKVGRLGALFYMTHKFKNYSRILISYLYSALYGFPQRKLKIIGVTGTDGKTTTCNFIYHSLNKLGRKSAVISTINAKIGEDEIDTGLHVTSPDPHVIIKLLRQMVDAGVEYAVLEVTSHSLAQNRFAAVNFDYGVFTNITREHLDYHKTFDEYVKAKAKLIKKSKTLVLNSKVLEHDEVKSQALNSVIYNLNEFEKTNPKEFRQLKETLGKTFPGTHNLENALAALTVISRVEGEEISKQHINLLVDMKPLEGRFNIVPNNKGLNVVVDFAHTPNALKNLLETVKALKSPESKVITLFGCAGWRDSSKRKPTGKIAGELSDFVVVTIDDPRTEDISKINDQIIEGIEEMGTKYAVENDREKAIKLAVEKANRGDWVVLAGKGHEKSMAVGNEEVPWSDTEVVKRVLTAPISKF